jgi:predicted NBD/HSP70 family sugar kinase
MTREQLRAGDWQHCLEGAVGGRAATASAIDLLGPEAKAADLFDAAKRGETRAVAWLREVQEYLAMAVTDIIAMIDPQAVVFGGGIAAAQGEWFLAPVREAVHGCTPVPTPILLSELGEDAQIMGAIRLALDALRMES